MSFRAILEKVEYRHENLDALVTIIYTDDRTSKVAETVRTTRPSAAWLIEEVTRKLAELDAGVDGFDEIQRLEGTELQKSVPGEKPPDAAAKQAYQTARALLLRAIDTAALGIVATDAKELTELREAAIALYQPAFISA